jgi:hypothetical protein
MSASRNDSYDDVVNPEQFDAALSASIAVPPCRQVSPVVAS